MADIFLYQAPPVPTEISLDNFNNRVYYKQLTYKVWKDPYSIRKRGFTGSEYFDSLAELTWNIIWYEIYDWVKTQGGFDKVDSSYLKEIYYAIMINIEFLRINKPLENLIISNLNINDFNFTSNAMNLYSDKSFVGQKTWWHLRKIGILRVGVY